MSTREKPTERTWTRVNPTELCENHSIAHRTYVLVATFDELSADAGAQDGGGVLPFVLPMVVAMVLPLVLPLALPLGNAIG